MDHPFTYTLVAPVPLTPRLREAVLRALRTERDRIISAAAADPANHRALALGVTPPFIDEVYTSSQAIKALEICVYCEEEPSLLCVDHHQAGYLPPDVLWIDSGRTLFEA